MQHNNNLSLLFIKIAHKKIHIYATNLPKTNFIFFDDVCGNQCNAESTTYTIRL